MFGASYEGMKISYFYEILLLAALVLLQVLLLNRISLFGYATPILYSYFLLKLPVGRNVFYVIISAFIMGLAIDAFLNTPGMNAAAITITAAFQRNIRNLFFDRSEYEYEEFVPGIYTASGAFVRFAVFMVSLHITLLFFIESFTLFNLVNTLLRIASSAVFSIVLIIAIDSLMYKEKPSEQA
jgi:rod shape-determining protein MreD